jgi:hypothetical protein
MEHTVYPMGSHADVNRTARVLTFSALLLFSVSVVGCERRGGNQAGGDVPRGRRKAEQPVSQTKHECSACRGTGQVNEYRVEGGDVLIERDESGKPVQKGSGQRVKTGGKSKCPMCDGTGWYYEKRYRDGTVVQTRHDGRPYVSVGPLD